MLDTNEILKIALDMVNWNSVPADTAVHVHGKNIKKVMLMIDVSTADLMLAKNSGCDAVITHHPIGVAAINFYKVIDRHIDYMTENGISTVLYFHIDYNDLIKLRETAIQGNPVILGHLAGDSIGMNALGDKLEAEGMEAVRKDIIRV